jgi:hypothetical protein
MIILKIVAWVIVLSMWIISIVGERMIEQREKLRENAFYNEKTR